MFKDYRLIQVWENVDKILGEDILIFELTPVQINYKFNDYSFNPLPSEDNDYFIYHWTEHTESFFMSRKEEIITLDLSDFDIKLVKTETGFRKTYMEKQYSLERKQSDNWYESATELFKNDRQIGFKFSSMIYSLVVYGNNDELVSYNADEVNVEKTTSYLFIDRDNVIFCIENNRGISSLIEGKIDSHIEDKNGKIKSISTISTWNLKNSLEVDYDFDSEPLDFLEKSERNVVITIRGQKYDSPIIAQWSLLFGNYMGEIEYKKN